MASGELAVRVGEGVAARFQAGEQRLDQRSPRYGVARLDDLPVVLRPVEQLGQGPVANRRLVRGEKPVEHRALAHRGLRRQADRCPGAGILPDAMKNGTSQAILVTDLFSGEGPYDFVAEAFLTQTCSRCLAPVTEETQFTFDGFLCVPCSDRLGLELH